MPLITSFLIHGCIKVIIINAEGFHRAKTLDWWGIIHSASVFLMVYKFIYHDSVVYRILNRKSETLQFLQLDTFSLYCNFYYKTWRILIIFKVCRIDYTHFQMY